jgi:NAD(P)-dependent dehydrogenase (short-subunit alcohol dehydrogenase family)
MQFQDKTVVITGGTGGLGAAVSERFLAAQANVVLSYTDKAKLTKLEKSLAADSDKLFSCQVDLIHEEGAVELVEHALAKTARIDCLVNLAGGFIGGIAIADCSAEQFQTMLDKNVMTLFYCCKHVFPAMREQNYGRIIAIAAKSAFYGAQGMAPYAAAKSAVVNFTQSLAQEGKPYDITANTIVPSIIDTEENRRAMPSADFDAWVRPAKIAELIMFLCSDSAHDISGSAIPVYGRL